MSENVASGGGRAQILQLGREGRFAEALAIFEREDPSKHRFVEVNHLGMLRTLTGDLHGALAAFRAARDLPGPIQGPVPMVGATLWLHDEREQACADWAYEIERRNRKEVTHVDTAGGVEIPALLWWASAHPGLEHWRKDAVAELRRRGRSKQCQLNIWPGSIVPLFLGKLEPKQLLARVAPEYQHPAWAWKWCQIHFYLSAHALAAGDMTECQTQALRAVEFGRKDPTMVAEYLLACAELGSEYLPWKSAAQTDAMPPA